MLAPYKTKAKKKKHEYKAQDEPKIKEQMTEFLKFLKQD